MSHAVAQSGYLYRLALIIDGVYRAVGAHIARDRTAGPTILLVCGDVRRRFFRFAKLVERVQLGILPRTRLRVRPAIPRPACERKPYARLPGGRGFLVKMMQAAPWEITVYASQLYYWLEDPAVASFLASYPQGRRTLRRLWRMVSTDALPTALREPGPESPREPGPESPREPEPEAESPREPEAESPREPEALRAAEPPCLPAAAKDDVVSAAEAAFEATPDMPAGEAQDQMHHAVARPAPGRPAPGETQHPPDDTMSAATRGDVPDGPPADLHSQDPPPPPARPFFRD